MSHRPVGAKPEPLLRVHEVTERFALAEWRGVFFFVWRVTTELEDVTAVRRHFDPWLRRAASNGGGAVFTVVERGAGAPGEGVRGALNELRADARGAVRAMASVYEAEGFEAAAMRSVATSVSLATGAPFPQRSFASVPEAAAWLCAQLARAGAPSPRADEVLAAVLELRETLERLAPKRGG